MDKKQATVGRIAFIHFGRTFGLSLVGSTLMLLFGAIFLDESVLNSFVMTVTIFATYCIIYVAAILYSAHLINTTYRIDDATKVVNMSALNYLIVTVVLIALVFFQTSELPSFSVTSFFEIVLFFGLSKWKIKNNVAIAAPVTSN